MGIFFCIGVSMMHSVHDSKCSRAYVCRSLRDIGHQVKETFPEFVHAKYGM